MFHVTGGQHLNSNEFFQAKALAVQETHAKKMEEVKKKRIAAVQVETKAKEILAAKGGEMTPQNANQFTLKDLQTLLKWKNLKITKLNSSNKDDFIKLYIAKPMPPPAEQWTEEDEAHLQDLRKDEVPIQKTALGIAAKQMATAVSTNIATLDDETRQQLLQSLARYESEQRNGSSGDS